MRLTENRSWWLILGLLAVFVLVWTVYPTATRVNLDAYGDMLENYAWGIGWQWGYFKHPPFFAWTTAAWFEFFPRADWAYYLLSALNAALALFFSWRIATRFLDPWRAFLSAGLFFFLPPVTFLATKFNANSALLPLWPLIVLFYLRFLENRRLADAVILGIVAAVGMLTKYFTAVLLAPIVLHILLDREARALLRQGATWIAAAVFLAALVPHMLWLWKMNFQTIAYAASQGDGHALEGVTSGLRFLGAIILYVLPVVIILGIALLRNRTGRTRLIDVRGFRAFADSVEGRALVWTTFGSIAVTLVVAIVLGTRLSSVWALPMFFALPIFLLAAVPEGALESRREVIPLIIAIYAVGLLAAGPIVRHFDAGRTRFYSDIPLPQITERIEEAWARHTSAPLVFVAGSKILSSGASFYARSAPYAVIENSLELTPWIDPQDIGRAGVAVACLEGEAGCEKSLPGYPVRFEPAETVTVRDDRGKEWKIVLHIGLPGN